MGEKPEDYETVWSDFWAPIVAPGGVLDLEQVKKELFDFYCLIDRVEKVYDTVTGGHISKCQTTAEAVISRFDEFVMELQDQAVREAMEGAGEDDPPAPEKPAEDRHADYEERRERFNRGVEEGMRKIFDEIREGPPTA